jgi:hypothetical protein
MAVNGLSYADTLTDMQLPEVSLLTYTHHSNWNIPEEGSFTFKIWITDPNNEEDEYHYNDTIYKSIFVTDNDINTADFSDSTNKFYSIISKQNYIELYAKSRTITRLSLFNIEGKCIYRIEKSSIQYQIPTSKFPPGIYILKIEAGKCEWVEKVYVR